MEKWFYRMAAIVAIWMFCLALLFAIIYLCSPSIHWGRYYSQLTQEAARAGVGIRWETRQLQQLGDWMTFSRWVTATAIALPSLTAVLLLLAFIWPRLSPPR